MAAEFASIKLGEVASVRSGFAFKSSDWTNSGVPVVKIANVKDGRLVMDSCSFVPPKVAAFASEFVLQPGDILIAMTGYIGDVALVRECDVPALLNQRVGRFSVRDAQRLDKRFLFYVLRGNDVRKKIEGLGYGSAQANVSPLLIEGVRIPLPPLAEQRAIASILGSLDDKIELNRKMSATLEAIARALFKSWFVDFDPVRAKAEGRDPGLPPDIAALFPDAFEDSELGPIPKGWTIVPLSGVVEINPARSLNRAAVAPYVDMAAIPTRGYAIGDIRMRPVSSGSRFRNGDTLMARITPCLENGKTAFVDFLNDGQVGWGSTEFIVLRARDPLPLEYSYLLARSEQFRAFAIGKMTGSSGRQRVPADSLPGFSTVLPTHDVCRSFAAVIQPMFRRISLASRESRTLASLRDALLPKLISGEIRVTDAERLVKQSV